MEKKPTQRRLPLERLKLLVLLTVGLMAFHALTRDLGAALHIPYLAAFFALLVICMVLRYLVPRGLLETVNMPDATFVVTEEGSRRIGRLIDRSKKEYTAVRCEVTHLGLYATRDKAIKFRVIIKMRALGLGQTAVYTLHSVTDYEHLAKLTAICSRLIVDGTDDTSTEPVECLLGEDGQIVGVGNVSLHIAFVGAE